MPDRSDGYAISNISLSWMIREIVAAGHHDLFSAQFPRINIPEPSHDDLKQGMEK